MDRNTNKQMDEMLSPDDMMMPQEPPTPEAIAEGKQAAKEIFYESFPGIGEAAAVGRVKKALEEQDYISAGIETAAGLVGVLPLVGDIAAKGISKTAKTLRKKDAELADKLLKDETAFEGWKKENKVSQEQKRVPEVQEAAQALTEGKITSKDYRHIVKGSQPIRPITSDNFPDLPTKAEIVGALKATDPRKVDTGVIGLNKSIKDGTRVGSRLDIPAYEKYDKWIVSLHDGTKRGGNAIGYGQTAVLTDVEFITSAKGGVGIAKGKPKTTIARIHGDYQNAEPENVFEAAKQLINDPEWTQVGMNPFRHSYFYDKATGNPVTRADEVIQVGPLVLARGVKKPTLSEMKELFGGTKVVKDGKVTYKGAVRTEDGKIRMFKEGGAVMQTQMEMFEDGGLKDEGGTVDPVSGNDVPPGSTQEEVRDDIPAQLSEGEFVFPADVVRYWGLDTLMRMRQQAKLGLRMMDDMGQMGNSEEATLPDDIPFDINDLDMDEEEEYNMAQGGVVGVPGYTGISGMAPSQFAQQPQMQQPTAPQAPAIPMAPTYTPAQQAQVPVAPVPATQPAFQQFVAKPATETIQYINPATGERRTFTFINGQPTVQIPEGFIPLSEYKEPEAVVPEPVVGTTQVREEGDSSEQQRREEAKYGPGGGRLGVAGEIYGVSFDMPEGTLPGMMGAASLLPSLLTKGQVPEGVNVNFKQDDIEFTVSGQDYNDLKKTIADFGVNSKEAKNKLDEIGLGKAKTELRQRSFMAKQAEKMGEEAKRQAQTEGTLQNKIAKAQQMEVGSEERSRAFGNTEDNVNPSTGFTRGSIIDTAVREAEEASFKEDVQMDFGTRTEEDLGYDLNKGGLASKPKPKAKKMKRGGLASKKQSYICWLPDPPPDVATVGPNLE